MKKVTAILIVMIVLVLGLWGGATYWFGVKTEERYNAILKNASQLQGINFVNESYSRGFLGSTARTVMEIQPPAGVASQNAPIRLTLVHDIKHGPFPVSKASDGGLQLKPLMGVMETTISLSPETKGELTKLYGEIPEVASMRNYTLIHMDGSGEEHFLIPAFQHTFGSEDKVAVDWKGLSFQCDFTSDLKGVKGSLNVPGLEVADQELRLQIKEVKSTFDVKESISGLSLGDVSFDLAGLEVTENKGTEPHSFHMQSLKMNGSSKASGDNVNLLFSIRTDPLKIDELSYGPGVFEMAFRNLDAASLVKLQQAVRELETQAPQQSPEEMQMKLLAKYAEIGPALLKKSPEVEITQFEIKTADGDFTSKAKLTFDGTKSQSLQNLMMLAGAVKANAEFKIAEGLVHRVAKEILKANLTAEGKEQTGAAPGEEEIDAMVRTQVDQQLKSLVAQNLLTRNNGSIGASASYEGGQVVLNGQPLPLQDLLQ